MSPACPWAGSHRKLGLSTGDHLQFPPRMLYVEEGAAQVDPPFAGGGLGDKTGPPEATE
jgi:hypothetical protein